MSCEFCPPKCGWNSVFVSDFSAKKGGCVYSSSMSRRPENGTWSYVEFLIHLRLSIWLKYIEMLCCQNDEFSVLVWIPLRSMAMCKSIPCQEHFAYSLGWLRMAQKNRQVAFYLSLWELNPYDCKISQNLALRTCSLHLEEDRCFTALARSSISSQVASCLNNFKV